MVITYTLAALLFGLSAFDAWLTQARIKHYGIQVELNKAIQILGTYLGPEFGSILGVMVPASSIIGLGLMFHLQWVLAILVGFRARHFFNQLESIIFEHEIKEFAATLKAAQVGPIPPLPPGRSALDASSLSESAHPISED